MPGDTLHAEQGLIKAERVRELVRATTRLQAMRDQAQSDLGARVAEVTALSAKIDILTKVSELFRALMDKLVLDHVRSIESIVSEGLKTIFYDQELSFEAEISQRYNRIAIDFFIRQESGKIPIRGHPLESFGGGPASIASLILRILAMIRLKRWPALFLDETLAAVSDEYIDQTGRFLKKLSESTGIPLLLVTHKPAFAEHASVGYGGSQTGEDEERRLQLHRLRGTS